MTVQNPPKTRADLDLRVSEIADHYSIATRRARSLVTSLIVAQMLPESSVVKGGTGIKIRRGEMSSRATPDLDAVLAASAKPGQLVEELSSSLDRGWGTLPPSKNALRNNPDVPHRIAFTGDLKIVEKRKPEGVPEPYVMQPYKITLKFLGAGWSAVDLEVGHDELELTTNATLTESKDADYLSDALGFGQLGPVHLIAVENQLAQKIHALTAPGSDRIHDLVDIQLLWADDIDLGALNLTCKRTFDFRRVHSWPLEAFSASPHLSEIYGSAREETNLHGDSDVLADLKSAVNWFNNKLAALGEKPERLA